MSWISSTSKKLGRVVGKAVPNEIKNAIPNEIVPVIDPVGVGGLNKNPSVYNTLDPLNVSGKRTDINKGISPVSISGNAPSYDKTILDAFNAQLAIQQPLLEANQKFQPQWVDLGSQMQARSAKAQMDLMGALYPQSAAIESDYYNRIRGNELGQLQSTLPQYQSAFYGLTPGYKEAIGATGDLARQSMQQSLTAPELSAFEQQVGGPSYGAYANQVSQFQPISGIGQLGQSAAQAAVLSGQVPDAQNMAAMQSAQQAAATAGAVPNAVNVQGVAGPQLQSGLQNIDLGTVNQYVSAMPGMEGYAQQLSNLAKSEMEAGRGLTAEEQRAADQAARSAYAARGTALGGQAVGAEILNRASVANQRFQQRLANAAGAAGQIQQIYQPALAQSLQRQQAGLEYGLGAQAQAFGQAQTKDVLAQQLQAQRYGQAMGTQAAGFGQAQARDAAAQALQAQRYQQAMGTQQAGFTQLMADQALLQGAQAQAFQQAMSREQLMNQAQQSAFDQALQRNQAQQQRLQTGTAIQAGRAQLGAGALGLLQQAQAPVIQAFYKQPILQQAVGQAQTMGLASNAASGNALFQPESPMAFQSAFLPYNASIAQNAANMQSNAAQSAGRNSMLGSLGGAAIIAAFCWVAREVYGTKAGTWKVFRNWILTKAPKWMLNAYIQHGEKIAEFISDKPLLKRLIKKWMDSKIVIELSA